MREDRKTFIGGSDAPGVLGISRWKTPLQVWAEKTGAVERDQAETIPMMVGKALEPTVIALFCQATGLEVSSVDQRFIHPKYPFMAAQVDARIKGEKAFLEVKTCTIRKAKEWAGDDEIPAEYIIQVMHDLACSEDDYAYIAVLIGNEDFKWRKVERDEAMIAEMCQREKNFWEEFVIPKVMPATITSKDSKVLYKLFPVSAEGSEIALDDDTTRLVELRNSLYQDQIAVENQVDEIENQLKAQLGSHEIGLAGKWRITWKSQTSRRIDSKLLKSKEPKIYEKYSKETGSRVLRIKEIANGHN